MSKCLIRGYCNVYYQVYASLKYNNLIITNKYANSRKSLIDTNNLLSGYCFYRHVLPLCYYTANNQMTFMYRHAIMETDGNTI